jgi:hypothetical protein
MYVDMGVFPEGWDKAVSIKMIPQPLGVAKFV